MRMVDYYLEELNIPDYRDYGVKVKNPGETNKSRYD